MADGTPRPPSTTREKIAVLVFVAIDVLCLVGFGGLAMRENLFVEFARQLAPHPPYGYAVALLLEVVVLVAFFAVVWSAILVISAIVLPLLGLPFIHPFQERR